MVVFADNDQMKAAGFRNGKAICPNCKRPTFVHYIDDRTGEFCPPEYGKCDRADNCGLLNYPHNYFKQGGGASVPPARAAVKTASKKEGLPNRIPLDYVTRSLASTESKSNLIAKLLKLLCPLTVDFLIDEYKLGVTAAGQVIFWQIDTAGEVRTGKIIEYDSDGHRIKEDGKAGVWWEHNKVFPSGFDLEQCLFGSHLLAKYPDKPVLIFEGEKTALIASVYAQIYFDSAICLATGGLNNLKPEWLECLAGRDVTLCPDAGRETDWQKKIPNLPIWKLSDTFPDVKDGQDFADAIPIHKPSGKALTINNEFFYNDDGEIMECMLPYRRRPISKDFRTEFLYNLLYNKEARNVVSAAGFIS